MPLRTWIILFAASAAALTTTWPSPSQGLIPSVEIAAQRGPAIFNSVHDSLRKWGSTVHPNGMSLFLATVPPGILLHHGNDRNETPRSLGWLAYEIEHAEIFARSGPPGGQDQLKRNGYDQVRFIHKGMNTAHGWLHTFRTTRPLQLLYIDGMSGEKDKSGVLDTQDYLLRGVRDDDENASRAAGGQEERHPGPPGEWERVQDICDLCANWQLDGVVRAEGAGFEIIKCEFLNGMKQIQSLQRPELPQRHFPSYNPSKGGHKANYRDVGPGRTILDYASMVSAFFFPVNLTNPNSNRSDLPRLTSTTIDEMTAMRKYLATVVGERKSRPLAAITWRDVADLIVHRYGDEILSMANSSGSAETLADRIRFLLDVFIDYSVAEEEQRNNEAQKRCSYFYIQTMPLDTDADRLIYAAFEAVNAEICSALFHARDLLRGDGATTPSPTALKEVRHTLKSLMGYLSWSDFTDKQSDES